MFILYQVVWVAHLDGNVPYHWLMITSSEETIWDCSYYQQFTPQTLIFSGYSDLNLIINIERRAVDEGAITFSVFLRQMIKSWVPANQINYVVDVLNSWVIEWIIFIVQKFVFFAGRFFPMIKYEFSVEMFYVSKLRFCLIKSSIYLF